MLEEAKASLDSLKQEEPRIMQGVNANDAMALARLQRNQDAQALQAERIEIITKSIAARKRNYDDSVKALTSNRDWEAKRLTDAARSMTGNGPSQMMTIPNVSVTFSGWDIGISDTQAGVKFKFNGVLSAGLTSTFDRDGHSAETLAFVKLFNKIQVFAGSHTNLDTGEVTPTARLQTHPTRPEPDFSSNNPTPRNWHFELPE